MVAAATRGERNNNPGNLVDAGIPWIGLRGNDGRFCVFDTPEHGIRALAMDLWHDYRRGRRQTIRALISEFAPPSENNTEAYVRDVAARCELEPDEHIASLTPAVLTQLVKAIIRHENGRVNYGDEVLAAVCRKVLA